MSALTLAVALSLLQVTLLKRPFVPILNSPSIRKYGLYFANKDCRFSSGFASVAFSCDGVVEQASCGWCLPDVEKGEVMIDSCGRGSFQGCNEGAGESLGQKLSLSFLEGMAPAGLSAQQNYDNGRLLGRTYQAIIRQLCGCTIVNARPSAIVSTIEPSEDTLSMEQVVNF
jgi:hypothetical protein